MNTMNTNTMSGCSNPRSSIQLVMEFNNAMTTLKRGINEILEQYNVINNTFAIVSGKCQEITDGYLIVESTKDSLDDAIREMKDYHMGIRVLENKKFEIGHIHFNWNDVRETKEFKIVDLNLGEIIKE